MKTYELTSDNDLCCSYVNRNRNSVKTFVSVDHTGRIISARCGWCGGSIPVDSFLMKEVNQGVFATNWFDDGQEIQLPVPKNWIKDRGGYIPLLEE